MKAGTIAAMALLMGLSTACSGGDHPADEPQDAESPMAGMEGMGAGMEMGGGGRMDDMAAHMEMMASMSGDSLAAMLQTHRQRVANMIARMNREMREMDMPGDEAWTATVDSLRSDLVAMPEMQPGELEALMPEHRRRAMRLMEMHREMMAGMGT